MKNLDMIFEELSHIAYMVKENNSDVNPDIVYEAFWDTVRKGARQIGKFGADVRNTAVKGYNAVKGGIDYVKELGQKAWDKIVSLGEDFVAWVKEVKDKVLQLVEVIKGTPAKIVEALTSFFQWVADGIGRKIQEIKTGWDTFVLMLDMFVFKPIANAFYTLIANIEMSYQKFQVVLYDNLESLKDMAQQTKDKGTEKWNAFMTKLLSILQAVPGQAEQAGKYLLGLGKSLGLVLIGLLVLPFYLAFKGGELLYKLGAKLVETISNTASDIWAELKTLPGEVVAGYEEVQKVPVRENRTVLNFNDFLKL